jgi:hypothetical protein
MDNAVNQAVHRLARADLEKRVLAALQVTWSIGILNG